VPTFRVTLIRQGNKLHQGGRSASVPTRTWEFDARDEDHVRALLAEAREQGLPYVQGYVLGGVEKVVDCARCNAGEACVTHGRPARKIGEFAARV
jgi:hypothetical protein